MADDKIEIELIIDGQTIKGQIDKIAQDTEKRGSKAGDNFGKGFFTSFNKRAGQAVKVAAVAGTAIGAVFAKRSIDAAIQQQDAVNSLNNALRTSGDFSQAASKDLQEYAAEIERTTRFGDELALSQLALAKGFGATNDQAKDAVGAAADLSAAFGIDFESAVRNVSKTLGGYAGELGEVIPELKELTTEQLRAGEGIKLIQERFAGAAGRDVDTFSGSIAQLSNTFGTLQENIGKAFVESKSVRAVIQQLSKVFDQLASSVGGEGDPFKGIIEATLNFATVFNDLVIAPFELAKNTFNVFRNVIAGGVQAIGAGFISLGKTIVNALPDKLAKLLGIDEGFKQALEDAEEVAFGALNEIAANTQEAFANVDKTPFADAGREAIAEFARGVQEKTAELEAEGNAPTVDIKPETKEKVQQDLADIGEFYNTFFQDLKDNADSSADGLTGAFTTARDNAAKTGISIKKSLADTSKRAFGSFVSAVGNGFRNVGAALAAGENGFKAFGAAIVSGIADIASAFGDTFIQVGIGKLLLGDASGAGLIAAGAALKIISGFLAAKSGGGLTAPPSGTAGGGVANTFTDGPQDELGFTDDEDLEDRRRGATLNLTVEGSIFDGDETPRRIADLLNAGFDTEDITLNQFSQER